MRQPKIIFVNRVYWPDEAATAQLLTDLATELVTRGWQVHVVTSGNGSASCAGVAVHRVGGTGPRDNLLRRFWHDCRFLLEVRRAVKRLAEPGDVVVLKTDPPLLAVALTATALARGARVLHWIQDIYPELVPRHAGRWLSPCFAPLRWLRNCAWRDSRHCLVPSADMRPLVEQSGGPAVSVTVIPNWAPRDLESPATGVAVAQLRSTWGLSGKFVVVYSGNLGRVHEFDTLLRAAILLRHDDAVVFAMVGDGPRRAEVETFVAQQALANVRFFPLQPRTELSTSLAVGDIHLVT
ncbi:MAG: glycosyltransferase family 4 protein, partial [Candidatus Didemnitutus sp.]|nr:glycosyltransferase family 4 protein [Candidatus Didemnitutus sp.]